MWIWNIFSHLTFFKKCHKIGKKKKESKAFFGVSSPQATLPREERKRRLLQLRDILFFPGEAKQDDFTCVQWPVELAEFRNMLRTKQLIRVAF